MENKKRNLVMTIIIIVSLTVILGCSCYLIHSFRMIKKYDVDSFEIGGYEVKTLNGVLKRNRKLMYASEKNGVITLKYDIKDLTLNDLFEFFNDLGSDGFAIAELEEIYARMVDEEKNIQIEITQGSNHLVFEYKVGIDPIKIKDEDGNEIIETVTEKHDSKTFEAIYVFEEKEEKYYVYERLLINNSKVTFKDETSRRLVAIYDSKKDIKESFKAYDTSLNIKTGTTNKKEKYYFIYLCNDATIDKNEECEYIAIDSENKEKGNVIAYGEKKTEGNEYIQEVYATKDYLNKAYEDKVKNLFGAYYYKKDSEEIEYLLTKDGKFFEASSNGYAYEGTYKIKNNKITFTATKGYGSDCSSYDLKESKVATYEYKNSTFASFEKVGVEKLKQVEKYIKTSDKCIINPQ